MTESYARRSTIRAGNERRDGFRKGSLTKIDEMCARLAWIIAGLPPKLLLPKLFQRLLSLAWSKASRSSSLPTRWCDHVSVVLEY